MPTVEQWLTELRRALGGGGSAPVRAGEGSSGTPEPARYVSLSFHLDDATNNFLQVLPRAAYDTILVAYATRSDTITSPGMLLCPGRIVGTDGVHAYSEVATSAADFVRKFPPMWASRRETTGAFPTYEDAMRVEVDLTTDAFAVVLRGSAIAAATIADFCVTLMTLRH